MRPDIQPHDDVDEPQRHSNYQKVVYQLEQCSGGQSVKRPHHASLHQLDGILDVAQVCLSSALL